MHSCHCLHSDVSDSNGSKVPEIDIGLKIKPCFVACSDGAMELCSRTICEGIQVTSTLSL